MKKLTILKAVGWFIVWIVSLQSLPFGLEIMNKPSSVAFIAGLILSIAIAGTAFYAAFTFGGLCGKLNDEYIETKN
jgi:cytosine/uracil/thiamine/allantoin permease